MIGLLITLLVAALAYVLLVAITGSAIVGIVAAILILLAGIPSGGFGFGSRFGGASSARWARRSRRSDSNRRPALITRALLYQLSYSGAAEPSLGLGRADGHLDVPVSVR